MKTITRLINNFRYFFKLGFKAINKKIIALEKLVEFQETALNNAIDNSIDNILYELPDHLNLVKKPQIKNFYETICEIASSNKSLIRFGDGEIAIIQGKSIGFQQHHPQLQERLEQILASNSENIMIVISYMIFWQIRQI
jgi:hypothetical protein